MCRRTAGKKIRAKTIARRLVPLISKLIHAYQTGFITGRSPLLNFRHLFNIMYSSRIPKGFLILILDAEKVFDQVEWPYLYAVLEKFQLGKVFISQIKV